MKCIICGYDCIEKISEQKKICSNCNIEWSLAEHIDDVTYLIQHQIELKRQVDEQRLAVAELANQVNSFKLLLSEVLEKYRFMVEEMDKVSKYKKKG